MIRELAIGSILLIAQAVPAFAEIVPLACTDDSKGTTHNIVFDTDARTVLETDNPRETGNHTYPMTMTDLQVTWQFTVLPFDPIHIYWTYNRNSGKLTESAARELPGSSFTTPAGSASYTCTGWQKPYAPARTFVSAAGNDSNSCTTVLSPCRHFAAAYAATAVDGEIDVLDPANYGQLTISHGISVQGHGWASVSAVTGGASITINGGDKINISGVILNGGGAANSNGIQFNSGHSLNVQNSVIRNFGNAGIYFNTTNSVLFVSNTLVSDNTVGIGNNNNGLGYMEGVLDHVTVENNSDTGITVHNANGTADVLVRDCTVVANGTGLEADSGIIRVTRSAIKGNTNGWTATAGKVLSYGDNIIDDNSNNSSAPPCANGILGVSLCNAYK